MFEFHGWAVVRSGLDVDDPRHETDWSRLWPRLREELRLFQRPEHFWLHETINGLVSVTCSGLRNHRQEWVIDFYRWLAKRAPGSYGLLYIHDDEDSRGPDVENAFRVFRLTKGNLVEMEDPFLSPYIPVVEDSYLLFPGPADERGDNDSASFRESAERAFRMCDECDGSGRCIACAGEGRVAAGDCPTCSRTGRCRACAGTGASGPLA
jgi:hypothetical protein